MPMPKDAENEETPPSNTPNVDQDIISEFEHAFDNHIYKNITNHAISEGHLLFDVLTADGATLTIPFSTLKKDHPHDCTKCMSSYVTKE